MGQMKYFILLLSFCHCGTRYETQISDSLTARISGDLKPPSGCVGLQQIQARVLFANSDTPCPLMSVFQENGTVIVRGECPVTEKARVELTLQYYVTSPAGELVVIGETRGAADFRDVDTPSPDVFFDSEFLQSTTFATLQDPIETRLRFNCDLGGDNACGRAGETPTTIEEKDSCSNYQELCAGTLFTGTNDKCSLQ
jgi:hypothetical protein